MRFKIQRSEDAEQPFYFELQSDGNFETIATSETYKQESDALATIQLIKNEAAAAQVVEAD